MPQRPSWFLVKLAGGPIAIWAGEPAPSRLSTYPVPLLADRLAAQSS